MEFSTVSYLVSNLVVLIYWNIVFPDRFTDGNLVFHLHSSNNDSEG